MPLDPSIALKVMTPGDVEAQMQASQMRQQQLAAGQQEMAQNAQMMPYQMQGLKAEAAKSQWDIASQKNDKLLQILGNIKSPADIPFSLQMAKGIGIDISQYEAMPPEQLFSLVPQLAEMALTTKDNLAAAKLQMQMENQASLQDYRTAGLDLRKQALEQQIANQGQMQDIRGQNLDLRRQQLEQQQAQFEEKQKAMAGTLSPEDEDLLAERMARGDVPFPSGYALRNPMMQRVLTKALQYDPNASAARSKSLFRFDSGVLGDQIRSFNVVQSHLNTLDNLVTALENRDVQSINKMSNAFKKEFGQPAPTNFNTAKGIVGDEITKAIIRSGGTLADREEAKSVIDSAQSPAQLRGAINTYKELISGQLRGFEQEYTAATGRNDFAERYLTKEAKKEFSGGEPVVPNAFQGTDQGQSGETAADFSGGAGKPPRLKYNPDTGEFE